LPRAGPSPLARSFSWTTVSQREAWNLVRQIANAARGRVAAAVEYDDHLIAGVRDLALSGERAQACGDAFGLVASRHHDDGSKSRTRKRQRDVSCSRKSQREGGFGAHGLLAQQ
jgi:hypothetical protein